ncbi:hypothetical protein pb186bvf_003579 [Paramecium bursaria]
MEAFQKNLIQKRKSICLYAKNYLLRFCKINNLQNHVIILQFRYYRMTSKNSSF